MENKQTIVVDEELLNQIVEVKVSELLEKREQAVLNHAGVVVRNLITQYIKENDVIAETVNRELDISNPNSLLSNVVHVKTASAVNSKVVDIPQYTWASYYRNAIETEIIKNPVVANLLHPLLTDIIVNDPSFKQTLQGHVELALKAKIEKFLNKSTYSLADELFDQFVDQYKEKRGDL